MGLLILHTFTIQNVYKTLFCYFFPSATSSSLFYLLDLLYIVVFIMNRKNYINNITVKIFFMSYLQQKSRFVITKNIWLNIQFSSFISATLDFILNAFHYAFPAFCFQVSKTQLFLLRLFVGFVDFKFKFCSANFEVQFWSRLLHVLVV